MYHHKKSDQKLKIHANQNKCVQILSRDSVTVTVDAVVNFNVYDAALALCSVDDFRWHELYKIEFLYKDDIKSLNETSGGHNPEECAGN